MAGGGRLSAADTDRRREAVRFFYMNSGKSTREIAEELTGQGIVHPVTGQQYDHSTIANDIKKIKESYMEVLAEDERKLRAAQMAKLEKIENAAWRVYEKAGGFGHIANGALAEARMAVAAQINLLGTEPPKKSTIKHSGDEESGPIEFVVKRVDDGSWR